MRPYLAEMDRKGDASKDADDVGMSEFQYGNSVGGHEVLSSQSDEN